MAGSTAGEKRKALTGFGRAVWPIQPERSSAGGYRHCNCSDIDGIFQRSRKVTLIGISTARTRDLLGISASAVSLYADTLIFAGRSFGDDGMNKIGVEAFDDRNRPEGGHAIILLMGLKAVPSRPSFLLRPAGTDEHAELPLAWPGGEHMPLTARVTTQGVELVVGPDLAENPELTPGTAVEIEIADAALHGDFLWPSVQPLARPTRKSILGRSQLREERADAPRVTEHQAASGLRDKFNFHRPNSHRPSSQRPNSQRPDLTNRERHATKKELSAMPESPTLAAPALTSAAAENSVRGHRSPEPGEAAKPSKREPSEFVTFYPHARGGRLKSDKAGPASMTSRLTEVLPTTPGGIVTAIVVGVLLVHGAIHLLQQGASGTAPPQPLASTAATETATVSQVPADALYDVLFTNATSPRGINARETSSAKSLENAQALLAGSETARDTEEGSFWLKRYLQGALGDERTLRALTHLGSAYADPVGRAPDYTKARLVWEMAGALCDPVAMCLLGVMHENGLGLARDKKKALPWYERAKKAGGCPDIDDSIARARQ